MYWRAVAYVILFRPLCYPPESHLSGQRIEFSAQISQKNITRADEAGFAGGDRMGVFVVNYQNGSSSSLTLSDNQANNVAVSYDAETNKWTSATDIYWLDDSTPADVYGYYPFNNGMGDVNAYPFEVSANQSVAGTDGDMGTYEASDFLWAKASGVAPGTKVNLTFSHRLAGVKVVLQQGEGFADGEWDKLPKLVTVNNTVRSATIDLSTGNATATGSYDQNIVMSPETGCYRAVVIPQTVGADKSHIGITIDGITYNYTHDSAINYSAGRLHTFTLKVDRKEQSGDFTVSLVGTEISDWEVDQSSHDFEYFSYLVVDVPVEGTLKECLSKIADYTAVKNLKVTGKLNLDDFNFMGKEMSVLTAVNLKDTKIEDDVFPGFPQTPTLRRVVLPETIKTITGGSFSGLTLTSTVVIPESVTKIGSSAFFDTKGSFSIVLPHHLEYIGDWAFARTSADIDLGQISSSVKYIGEYAFGYAKNAYGTFSLPANLEYLGKQAFDNCGTDLDGDIEIPYKIKVIPEEAFCWMGFKKPVRLKLHDGVYKIEENAFWEMRFSEPIDFPKGLKAIGSRAFEDCSFTGDVILPDGLSYLGGAAFRGTNVKGTLVVPSGLVVLGGEKGDFISSGPFAGTYIEKLIIGDNIEIITAHACEWCSSLQYLEIGKNVASIGENAFSGSPLSTIVCLAKEPPTLGDNAFIPEIYNRCVVEVPEKSVEAYRRASGWKNFKSITPHYELGLSLSEVTCLNKGIARSLMVRTTSAWEVAEKPDWVTVTPDHAGYKEEVSIKVASMPMGAGNREGRVIFRLKDSGYTNYLTVRQYDYAYEEDKDIVLQTASGRGNAIPVLIVGEGYGAEPIVNGDFMKRVSETMEHLFSIEPYKTYRNMFTVSTAVALSPDNGASDIYTSNETKFSLYFPDLDSRDNLDSRHNLKQLMSYAKRVSSNITDSNIGNALIIVLSNYNAFNGGSVIDDTGCSLACVGISNESSPFDNRALVLRYAGGEAFGGLANENITHNDFIKGCPCGFCNALQMYFKMKSRGFFENVTISGKIAESPWRDFMFHPQYSQIVDMYEGGYKHLRGVWRSESQSVMSTYIPYYNTISRYAIYKQIMHRAGLKASLDDFIANDKIEIPQ